MAVLLKGFTRLSLHVPVSRPAVFMHCMSMSQAVLVKCFNDSKREPESAHVAAEGIAKKFDGRQTLAGVGGQRWVRQQPKSVVRRAPADDEGVVSSGVCQTA